MRLLAIYNTRGMVAPLEQLRKRHLEHCDLFVHCGNSMVDYHNEFIQGYVVLRGSDDFEQHFLRDYVLTIESQRVLMINNLDFRGKEAKEKLMEFVEQLYDKMSVVICPLTQEYCSWEHNNTIYISPGDASDRKDATYTIVDYADNQATVNFFDIETGALKDMNVYNQNISILGE